MTDLRSWTPPRQEPSMSLSTADRIALYEAEVAFWRGLYVRDVLELRRALVAFPNVWPEDWDS